MKKQVATMKIDKAIFRYVEHELYNYENTKKELEEMKLDIAEAVVGNIQYDNYSINKNPGSSTETAATKLITNKAIIRATKTIKDIEKAKKQIDEEKLELLNIKYNSGMTKQQILKKLNISERTYFRWRSEIVEIVAEEMGLI